MSNLDRAIAQQTLSPAQFDQLCTLVQQTADHLSTECWLFQNVEDTRSSNHLLLQPLSLGLKHSYTHMLALVSLGFSVLVLSTRITEAGQDYYETELVLSPEAIAPVVQALARQMPEQVFHPHSLKTLLHWLRADPDLNRQTRFTLQLFQCFTQASPAPPATVLEGFDTNNSAYPLACRPVELALYQQVEQERLLNQVISQIHQSLDLNVILQTAVEQVRQFLQVDRLLIYQLSSLDSKPHSFTSQPDATSSAPLTASGAAIFNTPNSVTYEARASDAVPSALGFAEEACFEHNPRLRDKYNRGFALRVEDIETTYPAASCLRERLHQLQVRAKLVMPIRVRNQLWGLLIAHQCTDERDWQDREENFLRHIAEHLAIAINQAQLYARLQRQKELLEQRVVERTQHLKDAMLAAQAANRAKTEFLAAMSHELRTPLTSIIGLSSTLMHWSTGELTPRQQQHLNTIHTSGRHLLELINDILDLSQVESGKVVLHVSEFSLSKLAQQTLKVFQDDALQKQIELKLSLNLEPEHDRFVADPQRIRQILLNLLSNAIKFTPSGGTVILRVSATAAMAVFQVEDTGIGISPDQKPLLFEKFQQLETSYSRQYGGAGVGLALTKQLVELHGGAIDVQSDVGVGSVFTVRLPTRPLIVEQLRRDSGVLQKPSGRILLIEDREETATMICDMLNAAGYQMIWMTEGAIALEQMSFLEPVALILNLQVSDTSSFDFIRQVRQSPEGKMIKILTLSDHFSAEDQQRCLSLGADGYISAPFHPDQLVACVNKMLEFSA